MSKKNRIKTDNLTRFLVYILGQNPSEFGLVPDSEGFFTYKELLQAIHEESGWRSIRRGSLNEILIGKDRFLFQSDEKRIKTVKPQWNLDLETPAVSLPKVLYSGVRSKAHPVVMEKGLHSVEGLLYSLSPDRKMAERIGRRRDRKPVILEIRTETALAEGILFYPFGDLYLTKEIPSRHIKGPPVSKDVLKANEDQSAKKKSNQQDFHPGTFILEVDRDLDRSRTPKGKKRKGWKEEARKYRKKRR